MSSQSSKNNSSTKLVDEEFIQKKQKQQNLQRQSNQLALLSPQKLNHSVISNSDLDSVINFFYINNYF